MTKKITDPNKPKTYKKTDSITSFQSFWNTDTIPSVGEQMSVGKRLLEVEKVDNINIHWKEIFWANYKKNK
jgi:hypothetical protein